ncbi:hypothetical protein [Oleiphilus messinensis]|nr:hypothetical protein [Oleiphilus messinensis]
MSQVAFNSNSVQRLFVYGCRQIRQMISNRGHFGFVALFVLIPFNVSAHGLNLSNANVILRNDNHLTIKVQYRWQPFVEQAMPEQSWARTLPALASLKPEDFSRQYLAMQALIENELQVYYDGKPIQSVRFRFPDSNQSQQFFRTALASQLVRAEAHGHGHEDLQFQSFELDGFIAEKSPGGILTVDFPAEFGTMLVSYIRPVTQTLKPDRKGVHYHQQLY